LASSARTASAGASSDAVPTTAFRKKLRRSDKFFVLLDLAIAPAFSPAP
jgi:hypothetical protein